MIGAEKRAKGRVRGIVWRDGGWWYNRTFKGIRRWFNLETKDLSQAIDRKRELLESPSLARHDSLEVDCARFINWKLARREYTSGSAEKARHILKDFSSRFGDGATLQTIRTSDIQKWYDGLLSRGLKESTAESYIMVIRALFRWAVEVERCRLRTPARDVRIVVPSRIGRRDWLDKEGIAGVLKATPNDDLLFILFSGFDAGLRRNEIVEARVSWFDLRNGLLHVRKSPTFEPKDKEERTIPLTRRFRGFLEQFLKLRKGDEWVLRPEVKKGKFRYRWDFRRPYTDFMQAHDLRWVTPHIMRHSFASNLATAGVSIFKIAEWLGDDVRVVQRTYAKLAPADGDIQVLN
jgi:integrase